MNLGLEDYMPHKDDVNDIQLETDIDLAIEEINTLISQLNIIELANVVADHGFDKGLEALFGNEIVSAGINTEDTNENITEALLSLIPDHSDELNINELGISEESLLLILVVGGLTIGTGIHRRQALFNVINKNVDNDTKFDDKQIRIPAYSELTISLDSAIDAISALKKISKDKGKTKSQLKQITDKLIKTPWYKHILGKAPYPIKKQTAENAGWTPQNLKTTAEKLSSFYTDIFLPMEREWRAIEKSIKENNKNTGMIKIPNKMAIRKVYGIAFRNINAAGNIVIRLAIQANVIKYNNVPKDI